MYIINFITMTPEEKRTFFIIVGIFGIILICYIIYCLFKNKDKN